MCARAGEPDGGRAAELIARLNVAPADWLPTDERPPVLRAFPDQVPRGVRFCGSGDPDLVAGSADRDPVFRVEPLDRTG